MNPKISGDEALRQKMMSAMKIFKINASKRLIFYFILRAFSMFISVLSLPFILNNIHSRSFATLSILLTQFQFITILDWGLGNFIISHFTVSYKENRSSAEGEFRKKFLPLLPISSLVLVVVVFLVDRLSPVKLAFSLDSSAQYEFKVYLFYFLSLCNLILLCITKILLVLKKRDTYQLILTMNVIFPQLLLLFASFITQSAMNLVLIYQFASGVVYLVGLQNNLLEKNKRSFFSSRTLRSSCLDSTYLLFLIKSSYRFFILQLIGFTTSQAGVLIVSQFATKSEVTEYSIMMRILGIHIAFVTFMFGSSQSDINQDLNTGSVTDLRKFFHSVYLVSLIFISAIFSSLFYLGHSSIFVDFIGEAHISPQLFVSCLIFILVWSVNYPFSVVAISDFPTRWYFWFAIVALPINLGIAIGLLDCFDFIGGPLVANAITMFVFSIFPFLLLYVRKSGKFRENANS